MPLDSGTRLGPYEVLSPAGAGGMGEVYRARDTRLDRTVAIKVLPTHVAAAPELRERFEREARVVAALNHPHICTLHDVGRHEDIDFLVMEFLEGATLADRLKNGALPLAEALQYAVQIADALDKAHRAGIVHRDLKPGNIMLTKAGAKLLDFGLAKAGVGTGGTSRAGAAALATAIARVSMLPTEATPLTIEGTILGTLQYMAPEQLEGRDADARTDIFAFGAMLYEMVTGQRAFQGKSQMGLMAAIMDQDPPPIGERQPVAPPLLDHLVRTCLAKNPDGRWQHAADLLIQLKLIAEQSASRTAPSAAPSGRARLAWVSAVVGLIAALVSGVYALFGRDATEQAKITFDVPMPPAPSPLHIALSPSGSHIVAVAREGGSTFLWLRTLEHREGQILERTDDPQFPFWSPDGRRIAFFSGGKLKTVDLLGSPPVILCDVPNGHGGTWNADGVIVFAPAQNAPLFRVPAAGGTPVQITQLDAAGGETAHRHPYFLSDGDHFLYTAISGKPELSAVYVDSLSSPGRKKLVPSGLRAAFAPPEYLLHMRDNTTLMAQRFDPRSLELSGGPFPVVADDVGINLSNSAAGFTVSSNGVLAYRPGGAATRRLITLYDSSGAETRVLGTPAGYTTPALSPDNQRMAISRLDGATGDIWIFDLARGTSSRFTFDGAIETAPVWSPDGSRIVFASNRNGPFDLFVKSAGGVGQEEALFASDETKLPDDWSSDGRLLLYQAQRAETGWDLWVLPLEGDRKPRPLVQTPFREIQGRFSPDRQWFAYVSNETGRDEVYVQSFPDTSGKWQISTAGGVQPRWRRDGRELYFNAGNGDVAAVDVTAAPDGTFKAGVPRRLFSAPLASRAIERNMWDVTPDGKRFVVVASEIQTANAATNQSALTVVVNWLAPPSR